MKGDKVIEILEIGAYCFLLIGVRKHKFKLSELLPGDFCKG